MMHGLQLGNIDGYEDTILKSAGRYNVVEGAPELLHCAERDDAFNVLKPVLRV